MKIFMKQEKDMGIAQQEVYRIALRAKEIAIMGKRISKDVRVSIDTDALLLEGSSKDEQVLLSLCKQSPTFNNKVKL